MTVRTASSQIIVCRLHDYVQIIQEVPSHSPTCVFCVHAVFVTWGLHAVYSVRRRLSCSFFFPSSLCLPVYVCLTCVSCNVWCVSVAFNKVTGWIASTLKPSTWPQRRSGNLNASFPFLLWKYLPLAGKNTYTAHPFTPGVWGYPPSTGFPSVGKQVFQAASLWSWNEKEKITCSYFVIAPFFFKW